MKSAYEIAMERLNKQAPPPAKLNDAQKKDLAELDRVYKAKIAEQELAVRDRLNTAAEKFDVVTMDTAEGEFKELKKRLEAEWAEKREEIRNRKG